MAGSKKGKKFICLATSLMLAMSLGLAGCGGGSGNEGDNPGGGDNSGITNPANEPELSLNKSTLSLTEGSNSVVTVTIQNCADFTAESSAPAVATVTKGEGQITVNAVAAGTATITVKGVDADGNTLKEATIALTVTAKPVTASLTLDKESATLNVDGEAEFAVTLKDCADFTVESSDAAVATVVKGAGKATVTAVGGGNATITVKGVDEAGKVLIQKTFSVKVWAPFEVNYREGYTPTRFSGVSNEVIKISEDEGVMHVKNTLTLTNGKKVVVHTIEVDLERADIVAGTKDNKSYDFGWTLATPYAHTQAWEAATGGKVYASVNADFYGATCCNAFVKDGFIVKAGHNACGNGDYLTLANDIPASAPMLFGVKGTTAQIAPMIQYEGDITTAAVKKPVVDAKLSYAVELNGKSYQTTMGVAPDSENVAYISSGSVEINKGFVITVDASSEIRDMEILETKLQMTKTTLAPTDGKAYIVVAQDHAGYKDLSKVKKGGTISLGVSSPDGTWNGYTTILGCRQALVINEAIASTVTKENSNGAQTQEVPRTAVGIKDGKVVIFSVESLFYYQKTTSASEALGDTHGMNLPQLAEFAYYYGCQNAANFDGGGSTQLITHADGEGEEKTVQVRSADYNRESSYKLGTSRGVMNSLLVTTKKK